MVNQRRGMLRNLGAGKREKRRLTLQEISQKTIPVLFSERVRQSPGSIAFRYKDLGIYKEVTWEQYWNHVEDFALGLIEFGMEPGDRVAIMGDPCPEWIYADLAVLCNRGIDYGIYTTSSRRKRIWLVFY